MMNDYILHQINFEGKGCQEFNKPIPLSGGLQDSPLFQFDKDTGDLPYQHNQQHGGEKLHIAECGISADQYLSGKIADKQNCSACPFCWRNRFFDCIVFLTQGHTQHHGKPELEPNPIFLYVINVVPGSVKEENVYDGKENQCGKQYPMRIDFASVLKFPYQVEQCVQDHNGRDKVIPGRIEEAVDKAAKRMNAEKAKQQVHCDCNPKCRINPDDPLQIPPWERISDGAEAKTGHQEKQTISQMPSRRHSRNRPDIGIMAVCDKNSSDGLEPVDKLEHRKILSCLRYALTNTR